MECGSALSSFFTRVKKVNETSKFESQLIEVEIEKQALLAQSGKISELIVHGIGPIPFRIDKQVVYSIMIICFLIRSSSAN